MQYPKEEDHVNSEIKEFLDHFQSNRRIVIEPKPKEELRKREDEEKQKILDDFTKAQEAETEEFTQISDVRQKMKDDRQAERETAFKDLDENRGSYCTQVTEIMTSRNGYRDKIEGRHEKMSVL